MDITDRFAWVEQPYWLSSESRLLWCYMRMLFCGEIGLGMENEDQTDETLDGLLQVASNRCPVRTPLTQVTFFKLIIAFSSFFFSY